MVQKVAFVADIHVGNHRIFGGQRVAGINRRCQLVLDALRRAVELAKDQGCTTFVVAGDLFDTARPEPQVIAATIDALTATAMEVVVLLGNHDQVSEQEGDNAVAVLRRAGITVVETTTVIDKILYVPFKPGDARIWFPQEVEKNTDYLGVVTHLGIIDKSTPPWLVNAHDAIPLDQLRMRMPLPVQFVVAGNWHGYRRLWPPSHVTPGQPLKDHLGPHIVQLGALCPADFGDDQFSTGRVSVWTVMRTKRQPMAPDVCPRRQVIGNLTQYEVAGPRFMTYDWRPEDWQQSCRLIPSPSPSQEIFVRVNVQPEQREAADVALRAAQQNGFIAGYETVVVSVVDREKVMAAAAAAAHAPTVDQAVSTFARKMLELNDEDLEVVVQRVKRYLK